MAGWLISGCGSEPVLGQETIVLEDDGPGHQDMVVAFAPLDLEGAAGEPRPGAAARALQAGGATRDAAGRGATGQRQADTALPDPGLDAAPIENAGEGDVGALGK